MRQDEILKLILWIFEFPNKIGKLVRLGSMHYCTYT